MALSRISKSGGKVSGRGLAIAGTIVSVVSLLFLILAIIMAMGFFFTMRDASPKFTSALSNPVTCLEEPCRPTCVTWTERHTRVFWTGSLSGSVVTWW